jgi:CubicO group peptidase (beta-lactamase class C family)
MQRVMAAPLARADDSRDQRADGDSQAYDHRRPSAAASFAERAVGHVAVLLLAGIILPLAAQDVYYPPTAAGDDAWETIAPADLGWDGTALQATADWLAAHHSLSFLVLHRGRIVVERYWGGHDRETLHPLYSASKTMSAWLLGERGRRGLLSLDDPASRHLGAGWSQATPAQEAAITVRHLATMTSGLAGNLDYLAPAGTLWNYNGAYEQVPLVLAAVSGVDGLPLTRLQALSEAALFHPIGMRRNQ